MEFIRKPWGYELIWARTSQYVGKLLYVRAGESLSLQYHQKKDETLFLESGEAELLAGRSSKELEKIRLLPQKSFHIPPGLIHRLQAITDIRVFEVSTTDLDDVIRLEDQYGRDDANQSKLKQIQPIVQSEAETYESKTKPSLDITFRNMQEVKPIRLAIERELEKIDRYFEGVQRCTVLFYLPFRHRYPGSPYDLRIDLDIPGATLTVQRHPSADGSTSDIHALIRDSFEELLQKLHNSACAEGEGIECGPRSHIGGQRLHERPMRKGASHDPTQKAV